jgi:hypothetical protein
VHISNAHAVVNVRSSAVVHGAGDSTQQRLERDVGSVVGRDFANSVDSGAGIAVEGAVVRDAARDEIIDEGVILSQGAVGKGRGDVVFGGGCEVAMGRDGARVVEAIRLVVSLVEDSAVAGGAGDGWQNDCEAREEKEEIHCFCVPIRGQRSP